MATLNIALTMMPNTLHAEFHSAVVGQIERLGADRIGLEPDVVRSYAEVVRQEIARATTTRKSAYTAHMWELDRQRNGLLGAILTRLRYARTSPDEAVQAAWPDIEREIVSAYPCSIKRRGAQAKSGLIGALLADLGHIDAAALRALGVDQLAEELRRVNTEHNQAYLRRNRELNERDTGVMPRLRAEADRLYRRLCVEATYVAGRSDEALRAQGDAGACAEATRRREVARHFVGELQKHINYYKAYYHLRRRTPAADAPDNPTGAATAEGAPAAAAHAATAHDATATDAAATTA